MGCVQSEPKHLMHSQKIFFAIFCRYLPTKIQKRSQKQNGERETKKEGKQLREMQKCASTRFSEHALSL